jgi:DHA1 family bicyclomycin/chloramphenicol resistance-like MFS transporter
LTALPHIGRSLHVASENHLQWIISIFMLGFGTAQLIYGPLADRYGRKPILIGSMLAYSALTIAAAFSPSFEILLAARFLGGMTVAASRVLAVSIVRDCYAGRQMARVMSLSMMVFLAVPILAPSIGQGILLIAPWPAIFLFLGSFGAIVAIWSGLRLNETLHREYRRAISPRVLAQGFVAVVSRRVSVGYTLASTMIFGSMLGYVTSIQQIFADTFHRPALLPVVFGSGASLMAVGAFFNSRIVGRLGSRRVSHSALFAFIAIAAVHLTSAVVYGESILSFALFQALQLGCCSLLGANFSSMAMEPVGDMAGTASSIQGFTTTVGGALISTLIGQSFNGTTIPLTLGFLCFGLLTLGMVLLTERGRLFQPHHPAASA